jgi:hypothetical protein
VHCPLLHTPLWHWEPVLQRPFVVPSVQCPVASQVPPVPAQSDVVRQRPPPKDGSHWPVLPQTPLKH